MDNHKFLVSFKLLRVKELVVPEFNKASFENTMIRQGPEGERREQNAFVDNSAYPLGATKDAWAGSIQLALRQSIDLRVS